MNCICNKPFPPKKYLDRIIYFFGGKVYFSCNCGVFLSISKKEFIIDYMNKELFGYDRIIITNTSFRHLQDVDFFHVCKLKINRTFLVEDGLKILKSYIDNFIFY